jgi:nicotinate-nucleotide--dimethylbenzimidazole phosphoribosyltransferase
MCGAMLGAAARRQVVVVDGFIATAAAAVAAQVTPFFLDYCVFAHVSAEAPHRRWLDILGVRPLLDLNLRLGEGSGAILALPLLRAAAAILREMATFTSAGVSDRDAVRRDASPEVSG